MDDGLVGRADGRSLNARELVGSVIVQEAFALQLQVSGLCVNGRGDVINTRSNRSSHLM